MKYFKSGKYTEKQIDKEYRRLSLIYHPDRPGGSKEQFQELAAEYRAIKQQFAQKAMSKGDKETFSRIMHDIKNIDDLFDKLNIPQEIRPIAKEIAKRFGDQFTETIQKFFNNEN